MGGSGGHADAAAGSKLCVIVANLYRGRFPTIIESVTTVNTPGETVDLLVTEFGMAVNPRRRDIMDQLMDAGLPVCSIEELKQRAEELCGRPAPLRMKDRVIAAVEYRDGTLIDVIRQVEN
jgi:citrate lyase subunit alpha/citrate CoA-transferase